MDKVVDDFIFHTVVKQKLVCMTPPPYQGRVKMSIIGRYIVWNIIYMCVCVWLYISMIKIYLTLH